MTKQHTTTVTVGAGRLAALYTRASQPSEYNRVDTDLEEQVAACHALADALGYSVTEETTFRDRGPGTTAERAGLTALIGLVAAGRIVAVVTYTADRLARHGSELQQVLLKELRRREIPVYLARPPAGYSYDPATGALVHDPAAVAVANRADWRPPPYLFIPSEEGDAEGVVWQHPLTSPHLPESR